ncbi:MAG TPA: nitroreductase family protein [Thermodesulfobacteriota bacterium]|nr:nitroreductase family protein [Thermodesulfobacteriota bacterium]HZX12784.1 nitroreductase family protein [Thermodesulfobacteriota bacterium]
MSKLISDEIPKPHEVKPLDALEAIGLRRSIRWYEPDKPVERWKIQAMLEAARIAPTAGNYSGAKVVVCYRDEDPDIWEFISDWSQITTQMAPVLMFWCYDMAGYDAQGQQLHDLMRTGALDKAHGWEYDRVSRLFPLPALLPDFVLHRLAAIDLGKAIENALITAVALGLGTCLNGASGGARRNVKKYFSLPDSYVFCWLLTVGYPAESREAGGARGRPLFETMFFERKIGNPFKRDERSVELLKQLKLIQPPGPLPGRLEELNRLTKRFGFGDEWLTDWELGPSQLNDPNMLVDRRVKQLSKEEIEKVTPKNVQSEFQLKPTVKREVLDEYRKKRGIGTED